MKVKKGRTIVINTHKGGCAKTQTSLNLCFGISKAKKTVLLVDLDPSSNATAIMLNRDEQVSITEKGAENYMNIFKQKTGGGCSRLEACYEAMHEYLEQVELPYDIHDVLEKGIDIHKAIRKTRIEGLDIIPASNMLSTTDLALKSGYNPSGRLRKALIAVENKYDYIVIDCQPFENSLTYNAISSCYKEGDLIISPTKLSLGGLQGIDSTVHACLAWIKEVEPLPYNFKLLVTMKNRNKLDDTWVRVLKETFGDYMFDTVIRYQAAPIVKADMEHKILIEKFPNENVSVDYQNFINEVLGLEDD